MPKKNKVSRDWINQHVNDSYVGMAKQFGYRSRAFFKLQEIDQEYELFKNVNIVVDLGCAPGSWSQYAIKRIGNSGVVIGIDLLDIEPLHHLNFIKGDFTENETYEQLLNFIDDRQLDLIISDIAPNLSGIKDVDQARISYIIELVLDFAKNHLKQNGNTLIKVFNGGEFSNLVKLARTIFKEVIITKPDASRSKSSETYLLCRGKILANNT